MLIRSIGAQWVIEVRPHKGELCPQPYTGISIQGKYCRGGQRQQGLSGWRMRARHPAEPWGLELLAQHRLFQTGKPQSTTVRLGLNINPTLTDCVHLSPWYLPLKCQTWTHTYTHTNQTVTFQLYSFWSAFVLALQNHWDLWAVGGCSVKLSLHHMCNQKTAVSLTKGGHFKGYLFYKGQNACGTETCINMDKWRTSDF